MNIRSSLQTDNSLVNQTFALRIDEKRAAGSLLALFLGCWLGWFIARLAYEWVDETFPPENIGTAWGTGVAAAAALWKACTDTIESLRGAWRYAVRKENQFDHVKALFNVATIMFGIVLGFLGIEGLLGKQIQGQLESAANQLESHVEMGQFPPPVEPEQLKPQAEVVYVVSYKEREAPSFLVSPTLVFRSAGLRRPDMPDRSASSTPIERSDFLDNTVNLTPKQVESATNLISKFGPCTYAGSEEPLELVVYGFANDLAINNSRKVARGDSDTLNLVVANLRGEAVYNALTKAVSDNFPHLSKEFVMKWRPWRSLAEMRSVRDNKVFRNVQIGVSPTIDHRSAVIVVSKPGSCPSLISPETDSGSGVALK